MELIIKRDEIAKSAHHFIKATGGFRVFAFYGEMGAGKTTFIHALCKEMGVSDALSSPTFSIINQYQTKDGEVVYHIDLYRVKDELEAILAGVEECLYSGHVCWVEWPEKAPGIIPASALHINFTVIDTNTRKLQINL